MRILAVETVSDRINVALGDGRSALSRSILAPGAHDEKIFGEIDKLLKKARCRLADVDGLAVASGPGSFTGIRVGMTFVSVLSQALGKPAVAVSLLEAEAARAFEETKSAVAVVFPSSRGELFFQVFSPGKSPGEPLWVTAEGWPEAFRKATKGKKVLIVGPAAGDAAQRLVPDKPSVRVAPALSAADLIVPAIRKLKAKNYELSPLYLKPAYYERNPPRLVR